MPPPHTKVCCPAGLLISPGRSSWKSRSPTWFPPSEAAMRIAAQGIGVSMRIASQLHITPAGGGAIRLASAGGRDQRAGRRTQPEPGKSRRRPGYSPRLEPGTSAIGRVICRSIPSKKCSRQPRGPVVSRHSDATGIGYFIHCFVFVGWLLYNLAFGEHPRLVQIPKRRRSASAGFACGSRSIGAFTPGTGVTPPEVPRSARAGPCRSGISIVQVCRQPLGTL